MATIHGAGVSEASGLVLELWQQVLLPAILDMGYLSADLGSSVRGILARRGESLGGKLVPCFAGSSCASSTLTVDLLYP